MELREHLAHHLAVTRIGVAAIDLERAAVGVGPRVANSVEMRVRIESAITLAMRRASARSWPSGTTLLTKPTS